MRMSRHLGLSGSGEFEQPADFTSKNIANGETYYSYISGPWTLGTHASDGALGSKNIVIGYGPDEGISGNFPKALCIPVTLKYPGELLKCKLTLTISNCHYYYNTIGPYAFAISEQLNDNYYKNNSTQPPTNKNRAGEIYSNTFEASYKGEVHGGTQKVFTNLELEFDKNYLNKNFYIYLWSPSEYKTRYNFHAAGECVLTYTCTTTKKS